MRSSTQTAWSRRFLRRRSFRSCKRPRTSARRYLLLHSRYDLRSVYQAGSSALRLLAIVIGVQYGVVEALLAIVLAQAISTLVDLGGRRSSRCAGSRLRRRRSSARTCPRFVRSSRSRASRRASSHSARRSCPLILGVVSGTIQVGLFRIAQSPQTGLAAASSPARLVLLTEQTRDWEKGERSRGSSPGCARTRSGPARSWSRRFPCSSS